MSLIKFKDVLHPSLVGTDHYLKTALTLYNLLNKLDESALALLRDKSTERDKEVESGIPLAAVLAAMDTLNQQILDYDDETLEKHGINRKAIEERQERLGQFREVYDPLMQAWLKGAKQSESLKLPLSVYAGVCVASWRLRTSLKTRKA